MDNDNVLNVAFLNLCNIVNVFFGIYIPIIDAAIEESTNQTSSEQDFKTCLFQRCVIFSEHTLN